MLETMLWRLHNSHSNIMKQLCNNDINNIEEACMHIKHIYTFLSYKLRCIHFESTNTGNFIFRFNYHSFYQTEFFIENVYLSQVL